MTTAPGAALAATRGGSAWREGVLALALLAVGLAALVVLCVQHVLQGAAALTASTVWEALVDPQASLEHNIVRHLRLPRVAAGILAGASLAASGVLLQTATRNPMASPATLGVNAGAFLALVAATLFLPGIAGLSSTAIAFAGGLAAAALVYLIAGGARASPLHLVLAGIAASLTLASLTAAMLLLHENEASGLFFWGNGTLIQNSWTGLRQAWPLILLGFVLALALSRALDLSLLGDEVARGLGQRVDRTRVAAVGLGVFLAAVSVSLVGSIGFVGLVAPHLVRLAGVRRHAYLLPLSALYGGILLVGADIVGRVAGGELQEVPAGIVTALLGAPFLVLLARRAPRGNPGAPGADAGARERAARPSYGLVAGLAALALLAALAAGLFVGGVAIKPQLVLDVLRGEGSAFAERVVLELRLPRLLVAALAGAALAGSGVLLQGVVRNPLAAPDTLGVTAGAGLGALLVILLVPDAPLSAIPLAAFAGGLAASATVYLAAWRGGSDPARIALVGIAVTAMGAACANLLVVHESVRIAEALTWLSGSAYARGWNDVWRLAAWPLLLLPAAWLAARAIDVKSLGDDAATSLGLRVERARLATLLVAVLLASAAVATAGVIGFVGLVAPHAARLLVGGRHRRALVVAALLGALLVVVGDTVGRSIAAPKEIPAGLVTSLVGTPYFLWLLWRSRA